MGFGGINAHLVLEGNRELKNNITLAGTVQDAELVLLGAADANKLKQQVEHLLTIAPRLSRAEVTDLAAELADRLESQNAVRAAIVASSPQELTTCLEILQSWLAEGITHRLNIPAGVFLGTGFNVGRIGFLFPGQASPVYLNDGAWGRRFPIVRELYNMANLSAREDSRSTAVAQPSIVLAEMAGLRVLQQLGITATVGVGHSLGELSALHWAGAIDEASLLQIARIRGLVMAELGSPTGMMVSIGADERTVKGLLIDNSAVIAGINSPYQTIVSGEATAVKEVVTRAIAKGLKTTTLPISDAFHSPLVAAAVPPLAEHLAGVKFQPLQQRVVSTITGSLLSSDADIPFLLCRQVTEPVRFIEAINQAIEGVNLLLEVGPGNVLGRMIANFVTVPTVAIDSAGSSLKGLLQGVGAAFCLGTPVDIKSLFAGRFTRPFNLNWQPKFFVNPCERHNTDLNADARKVFSDGITEMIAQQLDVNAIPRKEINCERERYDTDLNADARKVFSDGITEMIAQQLDVNAIPRKEINCERERYDKDLDADTRKVSSADSSNIFNPYIRVQNPCSARISTNKSPLDCIRELVAKRAELPLEAIREDSHLLGDLHLNSITVGQLVAEAARSLDLLPPVAPTDYADATVGEVAKALAELASTGSSTAVAEEKISPLGVDAWIRTFTVNLVETPLLRLAKSLDKVGFWQIIAPSNYWRKASLEKAFASCEGSGVVVCLPPEVDESCVDLLLASARVVLSDTEQKFVLVQQGSVGAAFARTLHLEMPKLTTCVVNLPQECLEAEEIIVAEARSAQGYSEAHYDESGKRRSPHLQILPIPDRQGTRFSLNNDDVLLVTGGGKGIAAECALAIAKETGVRLALLGRSHPKTDSELATNLQRMTDAGIKFIYLTTDVSKSQEVERTVSEIETKLGAVTAIIHGAGVNKPKLIKSLEKEDFLSTLAPKVRGMENLLASVNSEKLRLLVTFGSIIARMGLPGEADYAIANEWLGDIVENFATNYPSCHCLNLDWSVWSGVGMGERLGRIDTLIQQGITPIPADTGIDILQRLIGSSIPKNSVVVTGRFGEPPTLKVERPELPFLRFLEQPRVYYPGVELVVDAELSLENDLYLQDHVFQDEYILPGVMGLEAMAQGAIALLETTKPPIFENVKFPRPVVVSPDKPLKIRIAALVRESGKVDVVLRCEQTAFSVDHFQATLVADVATDGGTNGIRNVATDGGMNGIRNGVADVATDGGTNGIRNGVADVATDGGMNGMRNGVADVATDGGTNGRRNGVADVATDGKMRVSLRPEVDLYGGIFFHQGRFQRLRGYRYLQSQECVGEIAIDNQIQWFSRYLPDRLILGDPGARDTVIHSLQACIPHARLLPIGIEKLVIHKVERSDSQFVVAKERMRQDDTFIYDLQVVEKDGEILELWQGLQLKVVGKTEVEKNWSAALLAPYMERQLKKFIPTVDVRIVVDADGTVERRTRSDRAFQQALGKTLPIRRRLDGKPEVAGEWDISAAHTDNITLAVASAKPISCDMEEVVARPPQTWQDLLGSDRYQLAEMLVREVGEDLNTAATRIWMAIECLKKASAMITTPLVLAETIKDGWVLLKAGSLTIATFAASVREISNPLVLAVLVGNKNESSSTSIEKLRDTTNLITR